MLATSEKGSDMASSRSDTTARPQVSAGVKNGATTVRATPG